MTDMHEAERQIILKLIHAPQATFNELWSKQGESNAFAYHVNKLESQRLIEKIENGTYQLTAEGRKLSAFIEGDTGSRAEFPTLTIIMFVRRGDEYLCQKRLKEPFYGYWGFIAGKINFGWNVFDCATRDLKEESGLIATDWTLKAIEQAKTFEDDKLLHHHYMFIVETFDPKGELKPDTHKAHNEWITLEEYKQRDTFPSEWFFKHIIPAKRPVMIEVERYTKNGKFVGSKTVNVREF